MTPTGRSHRLRSELATAAGEQFEILREIGRGGMGWVFLARDLRLNRRVALKVLSPSLLMEEGMGERFLREAQILASLRHAHVVGVHSVHHTGDLHFFAMDFIDGPPLDHVLGVKGRLSFPAIRAIAYMVGSALDYGHHRGRGVIHRDIKPANVILDADGSVVVTDFGISKVLAGATRLTRTGLVMGTPEYMSPEQCGGTEVTAASDQYSLGVLLYRMLCGAAPFTGTTVEVLLGHVQRVPEPIRELRPECPADLAEGVERMLSKDPDDRFTDIAEAVAAIGATPVGLRSEARRELGELARLSVSDTGAIDISSPLSPVRGRGAGVGELASADDDRRAVPPTSGVTSLFVGSPAHRITTGESAPIWIDARDADGHVVPEAPVRLSVDNPEIATLDDSGVLVGRRAGTVTVTAATGEIERHFTVEVVEASRPASVLIEPPEVELPVGGSVRMSARVLDAEGVEMPDVGIDWTIDETGSFVLQGDLLRAVGPGTARVTAGAGLVSASVRATAHGAAVPAALVFDGARASCRVGEVFEVVPLVVDADGVPLEGRQVRWRSSDRAVVEVDGTGRVRALAAGGAQVEAVCGPVRASFDLRVEPAEPVESVPPATPTVPETRDAPASAPAWPTDSEPIEATAGGGASAPVSDGWGGGAGPGVREPAAAAGGDRDPVSPPRGDSGRSAIPRAALAGVGAVLLVLAGWWAMGGGGESASGGADERAAAMPGETGGEGGVEAGGPEAPLGATPVASADSATAGPEEADPAAGAASAPVPSEERQAAAPPTGTGAGGGANTSDDDPDAATAAAGAAADRPGAGDAAPPPPETPVDESAAGTASDSEAVPAGARREPTPAEAVGAEAVGADAVGADAVDSATFEIVIAQLGVVLVDGVPTPDAAEARIHRFRLPPGTYEIRLQKDGFVPFDTVVVAQPADTVVIQKRLSPGSDR